MVYPVRKAPFEALTTIDERVDYIHDQLVGVHLGLNQLLEKEGMPIMAAITKEVVLRLTVQPLTGTRVAGPSPLTGKMVQIVRHWPGGCDGNVDVAVGHKDIWVLPNNIDTFVALNDTTPIVTVNEPIAKGEEIWMIVRNGDGVNPHTITATVVIVGEE